MEKYIGEAKQEYALELRSVDSRTDAMGSSMLMLPPEISSDMKSSARQ